MKKWWLVLIFFMLVSPVFADTYISNSKNWQDVYSVMMYGNFKDARPLFLVSDKHGPLLLNAIDKTESIEVYTSKSQPYVVGYESMITAAGYPTVKEEKIDNINLALAEKLTDVTKFVIIDDAYGYNSIAVAPYAVLTKSFVLFANSRNIGDISDFLDSRDVSSILIYGHVDRAVKDALDKYTPEVINADGDRFANNVEIVKKYRAINPKKQVVLTNGEFIEQEIVSGLEPVLFIGRESVPQEIQDYIKSTDIEVGVLIGNELVGTATVVRRQVGISTFVKFAQGARSAAGNIAQVEGLDRFPVPKVALNLQILSVKYNKLTGSIEITFKNNADVATYFRGTYTLNVGGQEFTLGDEEAVFIDKKDVKTMVYKIEGAVPDGEMTLKAYVLYGESKKSLEFVIDKTFTVGTVEVSDDAVISINKLEYDKTKKEFYVYLENIGEADAYAKSEIVDILILGEKTTLAAQDKVFLKKGETAVNYVAADLSESDLADNPKVHVRTHYGVREDALIKIVEGDFEYGFVSGNILTYIPAAVIVILFLLILFGRKKCRNCGHKNPRGRKHCKKCGHKL
jgi:hypothetical protein